MMSVMSTISDPPANFAAALERLPPPDPGLAPRPDRSAWESFARAPLVPLAVAASLGLMLDRYLNPGGVAVLAVALLGLVGWFSAHCRRSQTALPFLWLGLLGVAAVHHHRHWHWFPPEDIGHFAEDEPCLVRIRGIVLEEPFTRKTPISNTTAGLATERDWTVLRIVAVAGRDGDWISASGRARLAVERDESTPTTEILAGIHAGDLIDLVGQMHRPRGPGNPGERDQSRRLRDQRIRAEIRVSDSAAAVTRLQERADEPVAWLARIRGSATEVLREYLPPRQAPMARALLLGDTTAMEQEDWDQFLRTGVVHVLAISGQHLAVVAGFAWLILRLAGVRQKRGAWTVLLLIVGYTVLTGMRPSGIRAAMMVTAICGGLILRRPVNLANAFALAWIAIIIWNPTDPFTLGCQLSFLSVFVLIWFASRVRAESATLPFDELLDDTRPAWLRLLRGIGRILRETYLVTLVLLAVNAPLVAAEQHLVSPIGILIGPPVLVLSSLGLLLGFLLLLASPLTPLAVVIGKGTAAALAGVNLLVQFADAIPGGSLTTPGPPGWWLVGFYLLLAVLILAPSSARYRLTFVLLGWVLCELIPIPRPGPTEELRMTFLAVGKGGCTVIETPDGRCLIYDAGTTTGPTVVRRIIAPYLWHRGIRQIDELFLSHADTDHFNGVVELLRYFPIAQVTLTPSFAEKPTAEVGRVLLMLSEAQTPRRLAIRGDRFTAGGVSLTVLHPPPHGPPGSENERSLVLRVEYAGQAILLTGDLEKAGTSELLGLPPQACDVLMAPHHGSRAALPAGLLRWAEPRMIVVSRGPRLGNSLRATETPGILWDTWDQGAITLRSRPGALVAEAFRTGSLEVIRRGR